MGIDPSAIGHGLGKKRMEDPRFNHPKDFNQQN